MLKMRKRRMIEREQRKRVSNYETVSGYVSEMGSAMS
jgi:hypothetical protein